MEIGSKLTQVGLVKVIASFIRSGINGNRSDFLTHHKLVRSLLL